MFYTVVRQFIVGGKETHSMEMKDTLMEAQKRYFSIIATDLANADVTYQATYIIDSNGLMVEGRVFNRGESEVENA